MLYRYITELYNPSSNLSATAVASIIHRETGSVWLKPHFACHKAQLNRPDSHLKRPDSNRN